MSWCNTRQRILEEYSSSTCRNVYVVSLFFSTERPLTVELHVCYAWLEPLHFPPFFFIAKRQGYSGPNIKALQYHCSIQGEIFAKSKTQREIFLFSGSPVRKKQQLKLLVHLHNSAILFPTKISQFKHTPLAGYLSVEKTTRNTWLVRRKKDQDRTGTWTFIVTSSLWVRLSVYLSIYHYCSLFWNSVARISFSHLSPLFPWVLPRCDAIGGWILPENLVVVGQHNATCVGDTLPVPKLSKHKLQAKLTRLEYLHNYQ